MPRSNPLPVFINWLGSIALTEKATLAPQTVGAWCVRRRKVGELALMKRRVAIDCGAQCLQ
ncbi:hypothetical protein D3C79_1089820 [compost metagenome]